VNQNPYAPPGREEWLPGSAPGAGVPGQWEVGEVLRLAWDLFKPHWPLLVLAPFLAGLASGVPNYIPTLLLVLRVVEQNSLEYWTLYTICLLLGIAVGTFFQVGLLRIFLTVARGGRPELGTLVGGGDRYLPLLGATVLMTLAIMVGYVFLIVPGIIVALGLSMTQFLCVDAGTGAVESLKRSWEVTRGHKGKLFLFGLAATGLMLVGLAACCIGMYAAMPVIYVAFAIVYMRLSGYQASPRSMP
jgi:hypothetical protein